jgi:hypothetical protein
VTDYATHAHEFTDHATHAYEFTDHATQTTKNEKIKVFERCRKNFFKNFSDWGFGGNAPKKIKDRN